MGKHRLLPRHAPIEFENAGIGGSRMRLEHDGARAVACKGIIIRAGMHVPAREWACCGASKRWRACQYAARAGRQRGSTELARRTAETQALEADEAQALEA